MAIIDFHMHVWKKEFLSNSFKEMLSNFAVMMSMEEYSDIDCTPEKYLVAIEPEKEKKKEHAIKQAILFPVDYSFSSVKFKISYEEYLKYVSKVHDEYNGIFFPLVGPDPRHGQKAMEMIKYYLGQCDFKGLLLTPSMGFSLEDPMVNDMIQLAGEYKVPVILHDTGLVPRPLELMKDLLILDEIFLKYADQLFILCPFSQMNPDVLRIGMRHRDHLMTDLSAFNAQSAIGANLPDMFKSQPIIMIAETFGSNTLLFGSDWPWYEGKVPVREWAEEVRKLKTPLFLKPLGLPSLSDEDRENILWRNAHRVLKLE